MFGETSIEERTESLKGFKNIPVRIPNRIPDEFLKKNEIILG